MSSASSKLPRIGTTLRAVDERLRELAERDVAVGDDDRGEHEPGARRVRRGRRRRVAGRRAHHDLGAFLDRLRDRHRHAAVLERTGGVRALDLQAARRAPTCSERRGRVDERRVALEQRDDRRARR